MRLSEDFLDNLRTTIERFNEFARAGTDEDFHRGETTIELFMHGERADGNDLPNPTLHPLADSGPYYAAILAPGSIETKGGPKVNARLQMLDGDERPIAGLYGIGNCVASASGQAYWSGGSTWGPYVTFGYVAAQSIAQEPRKQYASAGGAGVELVGCRLTREIGDRRAAQLGVDRFGRTAVDVGQRDLDALADGAVRTGAVQTQDRRVALDGSPDRGQGRLLRARAQLPAAARSGARRDDRRPAGADRALGARAQDWRRRCRPALGAQRLVRRAGEQREHVHREGELGVGRSGHISSLPADRHS